MLVEGDAVHVDLELQATERTLPHTRKDGTPYPPPPSYDGD